MRNSGRRSWAAFSLMKAVSWASVGAAAVPAMAWVTLNQRPSRGLQRAAGEQGAVDARRAQARPGRRRRNARSRHWSRNSSSSWTGREVLASARAVRTGPGRTAPVTWLKKAGISRMLLDDQRSLSGRMPARCRPSPGSRDCWVCGFQIADVDVGRDQVLGRQRPTCLFLGVGRGRARSRSGTGPRPPSDRPPRSRAWAPRLLNTSVWLPPTTAKLMISRTNRPAAHLDLAKSRNREIIERA